MPADRNEQMADAERNRGGIESRPNQILSYDDQGRLLGADGMVKAGIAADAPGNEDSAHKGTGPASSTGSRNAGSEGEGAGYGQRKNAQ